MSLVDFEVFLRERLSAYDENLDLSSGGPVDTRVIQPILRRLGTDPFSVDMSTFIIERLSQEFPDLATTDGDAVSDLLVKPSLVLWDPLIREVQRVKNMLSFRDPSILTTDEAEALGANLFAERDTGSFAKGTVRIYFAQPQPQTITPGNFVTSRGGLHYFPTTTQSIRSEEMLINKEGDSYYFDVGVVAEAVGTDYNIDAGELVTIANVASAVRVTNKQRFRFGQVEQDAVAFVGDIQQSLTERSLVTLRGIAAQVGNAFSDITRMAVVGFNDPEMQRDIVTGGGLGVIVASGFNALVTADGENKPLSRRFSDSTADFFSTVGPAGDVSGFVVTLFDVFGSSTATKIRDLDVVRVINATTLEVSEQVLFPGTYVGELANKVWALRRRSITLSNIPGGILFPDGPNGTVDIDAGTVHIGGMTDVHVRGSDLDTASLTLDLATDDSPVLQGLALEVVAGGGPPTYAVQLDPATLVLGTDYQTGDATYVALSDAKTFQYTLQILEGAAAGSYRILDVLGLDTIGTAPILWLDPEPPNVSGAFRWRLLDELDIDLVEPKETRVAGSDGITVQNLNLFTTTGGIDFDELGVSVGDILRIVNGPNKADYVVTTLTAPFFTQLEVDRPFLVSSSGVTYAIFRGNTAGGVDRPLVRITSIDILDTTGQPIGTKIPYARPVDVVSSQFANAGTGLKASATDATLGLVSQASPYAFGGGGDLSVTWDGLSSPVTTALSGSMSAAAVVAAINVESQAAVGVDLAVELQYNGDTFVGLIPIGPNTQTSVAVGTAAGVLLALFGGSDSTRVFSSNDVRSVTLTASGWPVIDAELDVVWVVDGLQPGFYSDPVVETSVTVEYKVTVAHDFAPELHRSVKVGSRSLGNARIYFLEPTSAEVDQDTLFTYTTVDGIAVNFKPDPTLGHTLIPALPNGEKPADGVSVNIAGPLGELTSASTDFISKGVRPGDELVVDYISVLGSVTLADPVPGLALTDIIISLNNQPNKKITFINDVGVAGAVSRAGVAEQINAAVGLSICAIVEVTPSDHRLEFSPTFSLSIRFQNGTANTILGFSTIADVGNLSAHAGTYVVQAVTVSTLQVLPVFPTGTTTDQQFQVTRPGSQRITTSTMAAQVAEASLYYWDIELVSEGTGDLWNIAADSQLALSGYRSDGYYLTTDNETSSLSAAESLKLHISRSVLAQGVDDSPENAIQVSGQSLSISYERSQLVDSLQNFITSDVERVVCSNPLSRYLSPHFVRFDASYAGGSKTVDVLPDIKQQIKDVRPDEALSSSALQKTLSDRGATSITNPIELVAVVYNFDRSVTVTRSKDELTTGRLAAFIPDIINLTRRTR